MKKARTMPGFFHLQRISLSCIKVPNQSPKPPPNWPNWRESDVKPAGGDSCLIILFNHL